MQTAIVTSIKDPASINIKNSLLDLFDLKEVNGKFENNSIYELKTKNNEIKLYTTEKELIHSENLDKNIEADLFIFASKHKAAAGLKTLSLHPIGNFDKALYGGKEKELCIAPAFFLKNAFIESNNLGKDSKHEITFEATHHGPFLEKPTAFIEIGSNEENWSNKEAANIIAKAIIAALKKENKNYKTAVVFGGSHYNQTANKLSLRTNYAICHICPKYSLQYLDKELIKQMINRNTQKPEIAILDWKGLGMHKQKLIALLEEAGIKYERVQNILKS